MGMAHQLNEIIAMQNDMHLEEDCPSVAATSI